jgi:hypothetical protein
MTDRTSVPDTAGHVRLSNVRSEVHPNSEEPPARRKRAEVEVAKDAVLCSFGEQLDDARAVRGMTVRAVARESGLAYSGLVKQRKCLRNPSLRTLVAAALAVGCRLTITLTQSGLSSEHTATPSR